VASGEQEVEEAEEVKEVKEAKETAKAKTRGNFTASGRRCARSIYPALTRWASYISRLRR